MIILYYFFLTLFLLVAIFLSGVILIQENKSLGLGSSFGGDASTSMFGTDTASIVKKVTAVLAGIFLVLCLLLSLWTSRLSLSSSLKERMAANETQIER